MAMFSELEVQFADETVFNEQLTTFDFRIPVLAVRPTFTSGRDTDRSLQNRLFKTRPGYLMPRSVARLEIDFYLGGAQVDTATGALVQTWLHKLIADALGGSDLTQVGGVAGASASATALTNATGTRTRGALVRVGQVGDGRAQGQGAVIGNPNTSLLTGLPAAPNAADVVRACLMAYLDEVPGPTKRFLVAHADQPGMQYIFSGCQAESFVVRQVHGDLPVVTIAYVAAYWRDVTISTPTVEALEQCDAAVTAGGSYFLANVGTATRPDPETMKFSEVEVALNMGLTPQLGQNGGTVALSHVIGWVRTKDPTAPAGIVTIRRPFRAPTEYDSDGSQTIYKHLLATLSAGGGTPESEGRHVLWYTPRMYPIGQRPASSDWQGLQYTEEQYALDEGPDNTNDLTLSAFRLGMS
jgi:hypothetical protein